MHLREVSRVEDIPLQLRVQGTCIRGSVHISPKSQ